MKQIAEIHQGLAEMEKDCSNGAWHPDYPDAALPIGDCETCNGRGTVPLLPKLRRECPNAVRPRRVGHGRTSFKCSECNETGWVLSPSDTDNLYDALEEHYGSVGFQVVWDTINKSYEASLKLGEMAWVYGTSQSRHLAQWLAAENMVKDMWRHKP